ncbi:MATE family efflux transporter [Caenispirillum salinarum]|uniref:MATE family efflux transporter n=1 Tax=Caenispirillum salinarum TaxID=859058 RepID=UPI00384DAB7A
MRREGARVLRLALPILVTQLAYMATAATDTFMAGRLDATALAAVGLGAALWVPATTFIGGALYVMLPSVAGHVAARRHAEAGREAVTGAWLGLMLGAVAGFLLWVLAPLGLTWTGVDPLIVEPVSGYVRLVAPGLPFMGLWAAARYFCDGHSDTRPAMLVALFVFVLNIPLNAVLMYGAGLGVAGIGLSTGIGFALGGGAMAARALRARRYGRARLRRAPKGFNGRAVAALLVLGAPVGLMFLGEYVALSTVAVLVGGLGAVPLAAHQVAFNLTMTLFMIPASLSVAVSIRVGAAMGRNDEAAAGRDLGAGLMLACGLSACFALLVLLLSDTVARWYTADPAVQALAARLFVVAGLFLVFDAVQIVIAGYLRGRGDVRGPLVLLLASYWLVGMPVGWMLSDGHGVVGWWTGLLCAVVTLAVLMVVRLRRARHGRPVRRLRPLWR